MGRPLLATTMAWPPLISFGTINKVEGAREDIVVMANGDDLRRDPLQKRKSIICALTSDLSQGSGGKALCEKKETKTIVIFTPD
jgi:hypothetical protein